MLVGAEDWLRNTYVNDLNIKLNMCVGAYDLKRTGSNSAAYLYILNKWMNIFREPRCLT